MWSIGPISAPAGIVVVEIPVFVEAGVFQGVFGFWKWCGGESELDETAMSYALPQQIPMLASMGKFAQSYEDGKSVCSGLIENTAFVGALLFLMDFSGA